MTARIKLLAWIYIVMGALFLAVGAVVCVGLLVSRDPQSHKALLVIGPGFLALATLYFGPGLMGGWGLLRGKSWARTVIVVLSFLILLAIPIGTALGGFGLLVLLGHEGRALAATSMPMSHPLRTRPSVSTAEASRYAGLLVAMAGVAALFVVIIGTGFRVTGSPGSPVSDSAYFGSIGVLVLVAVIAVRSGWLRQMTPGTFGGGSYRRPSQTELAANDRMPNGETAVMTPPAPLRQIQDRVDALARRIDAPASMLPTFGVSEQTGRPHIEADGVRYHYVVAERGREYERHSTSSIDEVLYWTFRDATYAMASAHERVSRVTASAQRRIRDYQIMLLGRLDERWAARRRDDRG